MKKCCFIALFCVLMIGLFQAKAEARTSFSLSFNNMVAAPAVVPVYPAYQPVYMVPTPYYAPAIAPDVVYVRPCPAVRPVVYSAPVRQVGFGFSWGRWR